MVTRGNPRSKEKHLIRETFRVIILKNGELGDTPDECRLTWGTWETYEVQVDKRGLGRNPTEVSGIERDPGSEETRLGNSRNAPIP